jgi:hypothetical protein
MNLTLLFPLSLLRRGGFNYKRGFASLYLSLLWSSNWGVLEGLRPMIGRYIHIIIIFPFP